METSHVTVTIGKKAQAEGTSPERRPEIVDGGLQGYLPAPSPGSAIS